MRVAPPSVLVGMGASLTRPDPGLCVYGPCGPSIIAVLCLPHDAVPTRGSSGPQVQPRPPIWPLTEGEGQKPRGG